MIIRLLIVDDSAFVRKVVREMLSGSPTIEVVGAAHNGADALAMTADLSPDVVICDLTMPELDGVEYVRRQMARRPVPILIFSASPEDGPRVLEALAAGAIDFLRKPSGLAVEQLRDARAELVDKVKAAAGAARRSAPPAASAAPPPAVAAPRRTASRRADIVLLGISTGGPQALRDLIPRLPPDLPIPFVVVLHMPAGYTAMFAEKLNEISRIRVLEAYEGCPVVAGEVLIAPAGSQTTFRRDARGAVTVRLSAEPATTHCPSADCLFAAGAETYGGRVLAVVMTGMGSDGQQGAALVKARGGVVLTESEESCVIYGMPRSVVEAGLSDGSASLRSMPEEIIKRI